MATSKHTKFPWVDFVKENVSGIMFKDITGRPMQFVLLIHDLELRDGITKFIEFCGGQVSYSPQSMSPYAAVLVKDSSNYWSYSGDVFKVSYIESCYHAKKCLDISLFRKNIVTDLLPGFNYMDIIFVKKYPWTRIPSKYMRNPLQTDEYIVDEYSSSPENSDTIEVPEGGYFITFPSSRPTSEADDDINELDLTSLNDDDDDDMNTEVRTNSIAKDLKSTPMNCTDNSNNKLPEKTLQHFNASRSNNGNIPKKTASVSPHLRQTEINKHTRLTYSSAEKLAIIRYIVKNEEYDRLRGNRMWKEMETHQVCNTRTWQSMKEHFLKKIVFNLRKYPFLSSEQVRKIKWNAGKL